MWDVIVSVPDHCLSFYFETGGANLRVFTKGVRILKENSEFEAKIWGVNSVSGEKLHGFEIIYPATTHPPPPAPRHNNVKKTYVNL